MLLIQKGSITMINELDEILKSSESLPFLFVGSGFSKRYLATPDWKGLLKEVANKIDSNPFYFGKLETIASKKFDESSEYNNYMTYLCDLISIDLDELWFSEDEFKENREKHGDLVLSQKVEPIKIEISEILKKKTLHTEEYAEELTSLNDITYKSVAGLITTNYDELLENIFDFKTYNSQDELLFNQNLEVGEIYKIHGSVTDPSSLMINTKDYQRIEKKNKYIAAKLMTIFIEHPVIFMGYSIGDEDIRNILSAITDCLEEPQKLELQRRLIFIEWDEKVEKTEESTLMITFSPNEDITLTKFIVKDFGDVYKTVAKNKSDIPVKTLRKLKQAMYNLALSSSNDETIFVQSPDEIIENDEFEIIAGFGLMELAKRGYGSIDPAEIYQDIILDDSKFNNELLVETTLSDALHKKSGYLPYRKYLSNYPYEIPERIRKNMRRFDRIEQFLPQAVLDNRRYMEVSFDEALTMKNPHESLALVDYSVEENLNSLHPYLMQELENNPDLIRTSNPFRRLIRLFDFIKYT